MTEVIYIGLNRPYLTQNKEYLVVGKRATFNNKYYYLKCDDDKYRILKSDVFIGKVEHRNDVINYIVK